jgi:hypothetical protein
VIEPAEDFAGPAVPGAASGVSRGGGARGANSAAGVDAEVTHSLLIPLTGGPATHVDDTAHFGV